MYEYDEEFYRYISQGSIDSAREVLPALQAAVSRPMEKVLDVGCGAGAWLTVWKSLGARVVGLDGNYLNQSQLMIDEGEFVPADLSRDFDLEQRFDLVQSLEVAEHLPASAAAGFVQCLCRHSDMVLFSAAPPGQGGENHINEQSYDYWRELFRGCGYEMYDPIRPALRGKNNVKAWYRYNIFLYVDSSVAAGLGDSLSACRVDDEVEVPDISPAIYRIRKRLIRMLPSSTSTMLAILKKTLFGLSLRFRGRS